MRHPWAPQNQGQMKIYLISRGPWPRLSQSGFRVLVSLIALIGLLRCSTVTNTVISHAQLGPCRSAMDSVQQARGAPTKKEYNETEDLDTKQQQVEQVWYYTAAAESSAVVHFSWNAAGTDCAVTERVPNDRSPR